MKKSIKLATMLVAGAMMLVSCGGDGFKTTDSGLMYKFEKQNKSAQQVQDGDVLVGEMTITFDTTQTFSNVGHADRILQAQKTFDGDLYEGLLMMHVGDKATFAISADTLAKYLQANQMPPYFEPGKGMKIYYEVSLQDIVTKEELEEEQNNFIAEMKERQQNEPAAIEAYVRDNNITVKPNDKGVYVIVKKKGNGPKVAAGKKVTVNYTGRLLDGTLFDTSREADAKEANKADKGRKYEPMSYTVGAQPMIKGWEEGIMGQTVGSDITLVMPSELAYGGRGAGKDIMPYSPLVFNITIESVE